MVMYIWHFVISVAGGISALLAFLADIYYVYYMYTFLQRNISETKLTFNFMHV